MFQSFWVFSCTRYGLVWGQLDIVWKKVVIVPADDLWEWIKMLQVDQNSLDNKKFSRFGFSWHRCLCPCAFFIYSQQTKTQLFYTPLPFLSLWVFFWAGLPILTRILTPVYFFPNLTDTTKFSFSFKICSVVVFPSSISLSQSLCLQMYLCWPKTVVEVLFCTLHLTCHSSQYFGAKRKVGIYNPAPKKKGVYSFTLMSPYVCLSVRNKKICRSLALFSREAKICFCWTFCEKFDNFWMFICFNVWKVYCTNIGTGREVSLFLHGALWNGC